MKFQKNRFILILLASLLIFSMLTPYHALAETNRSPHTSVKDSASVQEKISNRLLSEFEKEEYVTFLVKLDEQVDTMKIAEDAMSIATQQKASPSQEKLMQRSAVVSHLKATSMETQHEILNWLEKQKETKSVQDYESFYIVNALAVTATEEVMKELATRPEVAKVLPNETRQLMTPTQTSESTPEEIETSSIEWNIERVGAPEVWNMGIDGSGTVVATIDTGVQWDHPALIEQYRGYDPTDPNNPEHQFSWFDATAGESTPYDDDGHGTHVTGTMVGVEPDGSNAIGVAPGAQWIGVKAFTAAGGTDRDLLAAGEWILAPTDADGNPRPDMAPDVVNNSWGGGPGLNEWYREMVQNWRAAGIFPQFAAGNTTLFNPGGPGSVAVPANYPESFAAGATDIGDNLAGFSLRGPSPYDEIKPDLSAPGVNIRSAVPGSNYQGGYNGTSMASPHVAGVVSLLLQADSSLTVDQLEEIMLETTIPMTNAEYPTTPNHGYGYGLVNAFDAVSSVVSGLGYVSGQVAKEGDDSEPPSFEHTSPSESYSHMDLPLAIVAKDNVSVTSVEVRYEVDGDWTTLEAELLSGNHLEGTYTATIPGDDISGNTLEYQIVVTDFVGLTTESEIYEVSITPGISVGYFEDFEEYPVGWYSYGANDVWEWGVPQSGPSAAASGEKVYGTDLEADYPNDANMTLIMPPVDLTDGEEAYLQFKAWYNIELNYDFGHVFISTDQENWEQAVRFNGVSSDWEDVEIDLTEYDSDRLYVAYNLATDFSVVRPGLYIDDVTITSESSGSSAAQLGVEQPKEESDKVNGNTTTHSVTGFGFSSIINDTLKRIKSKVTEVVQVIVDKIDYIKEKIDAGKIKPDDGEDGKKPPIEEPDSEEPEPTPTLLPIQAHVHVLETGRSVTTNPADGSYSLLHAQGDFTLRAESYGFRSSEQTVSIVDDEEALANFVLEEIPTGNVSGTVTNEQTGEAITNATLMLMEDANVVPVQTDENGQYNLSAYEGTYTLYVLAPQYHSAEVEITLTGGDTIVEDFTLEPFIGYGAEIGYDDGTAENARAFFDAGNGWAVRMSLEEGQDSAMVTGGLFRFWDTEWPVPGGTEFQVTVYDSTGPDGTPGNRLLDPIDATANRDGTWTEIDLSDYGLVVDGDFYLVYIQKHANPDTPGLATDEDGPNAERSWQYVGGAWSQTPLAEGNYMIRALVDYELTAPTITSPESGTYTNEESIVVTGESAPSLDVAVYNHGEEVAQTTTDESGQFEVEFDLVEGENEITAKALLEVGVGPESEAVTVILDQTNPILTIDEPVDGSKTNRETATVTGTAEDDHIDEVIVNGQSVAVNEDGSFSQRVLLDEGENVIDVTAVDLAGNEASTSVTITAKFTAPTISDLTPSDDKNLKAGETVKIEFTSEPGLEATFAIRMPLTNVQNVNELPMREESEGYYVGYWTATSNVKVEGAEIEVKVVDDFGNETRELAEGKLNVNID
ncbi:peptidase S8 [Alkalihalobacillus alcalophilus ATCC 27647 = CGMCC 1.3604]|uniref:Peptidase S8 n=1 Tax=Alkalihalobacillus alcalophilus ATCC 27647 = CGMCC 1.3604 TaxID=1218173 RepID=A0A094WP79_ALKAL|nr:S8 family peptidase [Alkalihalobacillus alcalophilus]KGA97788.1 peptidase S8 [Alkalihalobacillus alcalophilus ATCC 27647 = CGMCC 1.3604]MED1562052.1 S8 family serine peptidase [Alkalihalobacillus alcalophilus]THG92201.1 peptidase S8 [Alkalihalobacillus alcalophilus ATCC 27647 = CGMCC 1.3604]